MKIRKMIMKVDTDNMLAKLLGFPQQCRQAYSFSEKTKTIERPSKIIFCGMGGSAIGGDVIKAICENTSSIPVFVNREYFLPLWADETTLVIIVSYSGNTEETISALEGGINSNCKILCISSNGKIETLTYKYNIPFIKIPAGYPPRCAFGYLLFPCYKILTNLKIVSSLPSDIFDMIDKWTAGFSPEIEDNLALMIAQKIHNKIPLLYSENSLFPATLRWKTQLAENSKSFSFANILPEMNHNEIMAWRYPEWFIKKTVPIFIESGREHPRTKVRIEITKEIISGVQPGIITINAEGNSLIANLLYLVILGDWVSFYLAVLNSVNPTEINEINLLKQQMGDK